MKEENIIDLEKLRKQQAKISQAVEKFKKERAGLLPQFNLPGEEEPEEKEYPEELILAYELKEKIKEYTPGIREIKDNWLKKIEDKIEEGKTDQSAAWWALYGFSALLTFTSFYQKMGQKKMAQIEAEKAKKGLVKSIPPRPETRNF